MQDASQVSDRVEMEIGDTTTTLRVTTAGADPTRIEIGIGQMNVRPGPFRNEPPSATDLETAIEFVEEQLMPVVRLMPKAGGLCARATGLDLRAVIEAGLGRKPSAPVRLDEVEAAFSHLSSLAYGMPPRVDDPLRSGRVAAALLILREWMHHAGCIEVDLA